MFKEKTYIINLSKEEIISIVNYQLSESTNKVFEGTQIEVKTKVVVNF